VLRLVDARERARDDARMTTRGRSSARDDDVASP